MEKGHKSDPRGLWIGVFSLRLNKGERASFLGNAIAEPLPVWLSPASSLEKNISLPKSPCPNCLTQAGLTCLATNHSRCSCLTWVDGVERDHIVGVGAKVAEQDRCRTGFKSQLLSWGFTLEEKRRVSGANIAGVLGMHRITNAHSFITLFIMRDASYFRMALKRIS